MKQLNIENFRHRVNILFRKLLKIFKIYKINLGAMIRKNINMDQIIKLPSRRDYSIENSNLLIKIIDVK
jgi:hypothetical protein